jgi:hypothetical protein
MKSCTASAEKVSIVDAAAQCWKMFDEEGQRGIDEKQVLRMLCLGVLLTQNYIQVEKLIKEIKSNAAGTKCARRTTMQFSTVKTAVFCGANGCGAKGKHYCGACKGLMYCGKECQKKNWPKHKMDCSTIKSLAVEKKLNTTLQDCGTTIVTLDLKDELGLQWLLEKDWVNVPGMHNGFSCCLCKLHCTAAGRCMCDFFLPLVLCMDCVARLGNLY